MKEALKLALEALTYIHAETSTEEDVLIDKAIIAIKEALAQPAQGWKLREVYFDEHGEPTMHKEPAQEPVVDCPRCGHVCSQRQWVGLTAKQIASIPLNEHTLQTAERLFKDNNA